MVVYCLEQDDYLFDYSIDDKDRLRLGNPEAYAAAESGRNA